MLIGYARTSTTDQIAGLEAQERDLLAQGCERASHVNYWSQIPGPLHGFSKTQKKQILVMPKFASIWQLKVNHFRSESSQDCITL
jgi:hypothetical protein